MSDDNNVRRSVSENAKNERQRCYNLSEIPSKQSLSSEELALPEDAFSVGKENMPLLESSSETIIKSLCTPRSRASSTREGQSEHPHKAYEMKKERNSQLQCRIVKDTLSLDSKEKRKHISNRPKSSSVPANRKFSSHASSHLTPVAEIPLLSSPDDNCWELKIKTSRSRPYSNLPSPVLRSSVQLRKLSFRASEPHSKNGCSNENHLTLLGKPKSQAGSKHKHNTKYRKWQTDAFNFLEQPKGVQVLYHVLTFLLIFGCLVLSVLATVEPYKVFSSRVLFWLEIVILIFFTCELIVRFWSAGCRCRYQGLRGMLKFAKKPFCIIDIIVILSSLIVICAGSQGNVFAATAMRSLRFLQILRMVRMDRRGGTWKLLSSVVKAHSKELLTAWYIGFLTLVFASFLVYQAEKDFNEEMFGTYADALWWGLVTLATIGYGDKVPKTWVGRLIASGFSIIGISFFALPAGILGSGFALKVQEQHRQKHFARRRMPAAYLIQSMWKCYAADKNSRSVATWLPHLRARMDKKKLKNVMRNSASPKFCRKPTTRSRLGAKSSVIISPMIPNGAHAPLSPIFGSARIEFSKSQSLAEKLGEKISRQNAIRVPWRDKAYYDKKSIDASDSVHDNDYNDGYSSNTSDDDNGVTVLTEQHKTAVRCIRMMKFMVAKRKFKEALRPYDVKDVIEQYSSGHVEMLSRIKNLQNRIDEIVGLSSDSYTGNSSSFYRTRGRLDSCEMRVHSNSMNSRLSKVEADLTTIDEKLELILHVVRSRNVSVASTTSQRFNDGSQQKDFNLKNPPPKVFIVDEETRETDSTNEPHITGVTGKKDEANTSKGTKKSFARGFRSRKMPSRYLRPASDWDNIPQGETETEQIHLTGNLPDSAEANNDATFKVKAESTIMARKIVKPKDRPTPDNQLKEIGSKFKTKSRRKGSLLRQIRNLGSPTRGSLKNSLLREKKRVNSNGDIFQSVSTHRSDLIDGKRCYSCNNLNCADECDFLVDEVHQRSKQCTANDVVWGTTENNKLSVQEQTSEEPSIQGVENSCNVERDSSRQDASSERKKPAPLQETSVILRLNKSADSLSPPTQSMVKTNITSNNFKVDEKTLSQKNFLPAEVVVSQLKKAEFIPMTERQLHLGVKNANECLNRKCFSTENTSYDRSLNLELPGETSSPISAVSKSKLNDEISLSSGAALPTVSNSLDIV